MVCNWILPQFNYMARSLLHPNLILSDFLLGVLASGLVVYVPCEAWLEGALARRWCQVCSVAADSWSFQASVCEGLHPDHDPDLLCSGLPAGDTQAGRVPPAREPSHERPVQPALVGIQGDA